MTGWKIVDSNGEVYKSFYDAAKAYAGNRTLTFETREFDMSGQRVLDVTNEVSVRARSLGLLPISAATEQPLGCEFCDDGWVNIEAVHDEVEGYIEQGDPCPECSAYQPLDETEDEA